MNIADTAAIISAAANVVLAGGLILAWQQLKSDRRADNISRALAFHSELSTGEAGAARRRLGDFCFIGDETGTNARYRRPTPSQLQAARSGDNFTDVGQDLLSDAIGLIRTFKRLWIAIDSGTADPDLSFRLNGWDAVWWSLIFSRFSAHDAEPIEALNRLADWAWSRAVEAGLAQGERLKCFEPISLDGKAFPWHRFLLVEFGSLTDD